MQLWDKIDLKIYFFLLMCVGRDASRSWILWSGVADNVYFHVGPANCSWVPCEASKHS